MVVDDDRSSPVPAPGIARRRVAGETILVPVSGDLARLQEIYVLDEVADHIWQRLDGRTPIEAIVDSLTDTFDVDRETARRDLEAFVEALSAAGLVTEVRDDG
jgi:hypothetical protein